ncbi:uncharacterized protein LOC128497657 [Spea bombifrons]|uniref:uncharacterized protein LOC128497657 n=1 Tax=Spea bombifrons TaxID=233779 RepID=UPI0023497B65|nr:uncharacterized protein LOC128497657 [Spea bombifrons]
MSFLPHALQDDCDSDREVISMDLSECDPDEFLCNNELFDFLDSFKILNNGDVQFVLKVTERFSHALVNHKKSEEVRNTMMHDVGNKPPYQQSYDRSKERLNKNPGTNYQQNLQTDSSSNRGPVNEQRLHTQYPSEFGRNYNQNNEQPNPQYQRGHVTGPRPAGRLSTTTHDELGNFNQRKKVPDSQFNGGPIRESMPLLHTARPPSSHEGI